MGHYGVGRASKICLLIAGSCADLRCSYARLKEASMIDEVLPAAQIENASVHAWIAARRRESKLVRHQVPFSASHEWLLDEGYLRHRTSRFFTIAGLQARSMCRSFPEINQPIILQPEVGLLGFLLHRTPNGLRILAQAKTEPGNVYGTQIAPSAQATRSNYEMVHGGSQTPYLDCFLAPTVSGLISDVLQSEQGTRFFRKYNRNISIVVDENVEPLDDRWRWLEARTLLSALHEHFLINTDARSSLVCSDWSVLSTPDEPFSRHRHHDAFQQALRESWLAGDDEAALGTSAIVSHLGDTRRSTRGTVQIVPLEQLDGWFRDEGGVISTTRTAFSVRQFSVETADREVPRWDQPLIVSHGTGHAYLLCQRRNGILHFLLRPSVEVGFQEFAQYGPTLQAEQEMDRDPFDTWKQVVAEGILRARCLQSDEGGRFCDSVVDYRVIELPDTMPFSEPPSIVGVTLSQLHTLLRSPGLLTNELRTCISLLLRFL